MATLETSAAKKAKELINKFMRFTPAEEEYEYPYAKACALICVDEIIDTWKWMTHLSGAKSKAAKGIINYWQEVKSFIEKS